MDEIRRRADKRGGLTQAQRDAIMARSGEWAHELWTSYGDGHATHRVVTGELQTVEPKGLVGVVRGACGVTRSLLESTWQRVGSPRFVQCKRCLKSARRGDLGALIVLTERLGPKTVHMERTWEFPSRMHRLPSAIPAHDVHYDPTFPRDTAWEGAIHRILFEADPALARARQERPPPPLNLWDVLRDEDEW